MRWSLILVVSLLAGNVIADEWHEKRAVTVLAFAQAQEAEEGLSPSSDKCLGCYGTGKVGDGRVTFKCPSCNGTGKKKASGAEPPAVSSSAPVGDDDPELYGLRYTARWCEPCKIYERDHEAGVSLKFTTFDVSDDEKTIESAGVESLPYFILCDRDLETVLDRIQGLHTADQMNAKIESARALKRKRKKENEATAPKATVKIFVTRPGSQSFGSGTVMTISSDGRTALVLTCAHVIEQGGDVFVEMFSPAGVKRLPATVVKRNDDIDLAAIRVVNDGTITVANNMQIGNCVRAKTPATVYGYPDGGNFFELTTSIIGSSKDEKYEGQDFVLFATDPQSGISGGGLFVEGTLVGVVSMADRERKIGFAVRTTDVRAFLKDL